MRVGLSDSRKKIFLLSLEPFDFNSAFRLLHYNSFNLDRAMVIYIGCFMFVFRFSFIVCLVFSFCKFKILMNLVFLMFLCLCVCVVSDFIKRSFTSSDKSEVQSSR